MKAYHRYRKTLFYDAVVDAVIILVYRNVKVFRDSSTAWHTRPIGGEVASRKPLRTRIVNPGLTLHISVPDGLVPARAGVSSSALVRNPENVFNLRGNDVASCTFCG